MVRGKSTGWLDITSRPVAFLLSGVMLLYLGCFSLVSFSSDLSDGYLNVIANGLDSEHISLISSSSSEFNTVLRNLLGNTDTAARELVPFLVIVSNRSPNTIVAYALSWKLKRDTGDKFNISAQFKYPDAVAGVPDTGAIALGVSADGSIATGKQKIVAMEFEFDQPENKQDWSAWIREVAAWQKQEYGDVHSVQVDLDAAIFANGLLVGPDSSQLGMHFSTYVAAKQELFRQITASLDSGSTVEEAFRAIDLMAETELVHPERDLSLYYHRLAAQEIKALRRRIGDQTTKVMCKKAIREQPFVIRRGSGHDREEDRK